jgi:hypothetical protein
MRPIARTPHRTRGGLVLVHPDRPRTPGQRHGAGPPYSGDRTSRADTRGGSAGVLRPTGSVEAGTACRSFTTSPQGRHPPAHGGGSQPRRESRPAGSDGRSTNLQGPRYCRKSLAQPPTVPFRVTATSVGSDSDGRNDQYLEIRRPPPPTPPDRPLPGPVMLVRDVPR